MNLTDLSCAVQFEKGLKGPIETFDTVKYGFRVKKWGFSYNASTTQHISGMRQSGGRLTRSPLILVLTDEHYTDILAAANAHTSLGDTTIVIVHNRPKGERDTHVNLVVHNSSIKHMCTLKGDGLKYLAISELSKNSLDLNFDFPKYVRDLSRVDRSREPRKQDAGGTYIVIALDYTKMKFVYHQIDTKGKALGKNAFQYDSERKK